MTKRFIALLCFLMLATLVFSQVQPSYLYNTGMPYGTLDIRTKISATNYFYLDKDKTFSFRESAPGVRTNTFLDMTPTWDSSPYMQGNMRRKDGAADYFVMNYRLLMPVNYQSDYAKGYPMIVQMHGAAERGNCYYNDCHHGNWDYDPNTNNPPAPTNADHELLNNDHQLIMGGSQHLAARDLANGMLPDDASLPPRAFPGFVLYPQMFNAWDSVRVEDMIKLVQLTIENYNVDPDRVYIHGLSIGGYATYEAIKRAPWLFAAALPMSAVTEAANIFKHNLQDKVAHIPVWAFQGGLDPRPSPAQTEAIMAKFKAAGGSFTYTMYPELSHNVWNKAYIEPTFFSWMLKQSKSQLHVSGDNTTIVKNENIFPKLVLAEGYLAYQWEKDGAVIASAKTNSLTVSEAGVYRARFSRVAAAPAENQWNEWSSPITIKNGTVDEVGGGVTAVLPGSEFSYAVYPNPANSENINVYFQKSSKNVTVTLLDAIGRPVEEKFVRQGVSDNEPVTLSKKLSGGVYMLIIKHGDEQFKERVLIRN